MYFVVSVMGAKGVSLVSISIRSTDAVVNRGCFLVVRLNGVVVIAIGFRVVVDDEFDVPGSMSSFGFIGNPVRGAFLTGAFVLLPAAVSFLLCDLVIPANVPEVVASLPSDITVSDLVLNAAIII